RLVRISRDEQVSYLYTANVSNKFYETYTYNIKDTNKDTSFRTTLAILLGRKRTIQLLKALVVLLYVSVIFTALSGLLPMKVLLVLVALPKGMKLLPSFQEKVSAE